VTITLGAAYFIGHAFARLLVQKTGRKAPRVSVGRDCRMRCGACASCSSLPAALCSHARTG